MGQGTDKFLIRMLDILTNSTELGAAIRAERRRIGVTQKELAMTAGVGLRYLIELERGKPTARMEGMFKVLQALGLKLTVTPPSGPTEPGRYEHADRLSTQ